LNTPPFLTALKSDFEAQEAASTEITGLDFDPFLNTQDPCEHYEAGMVSKRHERFYADIHSVCAGQRSAGAVLVAELQRSGGNLLFANFFYTKEGSDLLTILRRLRESRNVEPM
jgi:hypothetical protein